MDVLDSLYIQCYNGMNIERILVILTTLYAVADSGSNAPSPLCYATGHGIRNMNCGTYPEYKPSIFHSKTLEIPPPPWKMYVMIET